MRLISKALTKANLRASARRQARESAGGATPKVTSKTVPAGLTPQNLSAAYSLPTETPASSSQTHVTQVRFGSLAATFKVLSATQIVSPTTLKAVVSAAASTGLITVTNAAAPVGSVTSSGNFVVA